MSIPLYIITPPARLYTLPAFLIEEASKNSRIGLNHVQQACDFIANNYSRHITIEDIAYHANLSRSRLCRVFNKHISVSPLRYLREFRLREAESILVKLPYLDNYTVYNTSVRGIQMEINIEKARPDDYEEVIDFGNYVFSHSSGPTDFPAMLPKLYKREYFMDSIHYLIREEGKIKALVGAYPLEWEFRGGETGVTLPGRGIGMVSAHPYSRSRGYMRALMNRALDDMKREGIVFSCLGGRRQRYEYFGFGPAGTGFTFTVNEANITHTLGPDWKTNLSLSPVGAGDEALLDSVQALHEAKTARLRRPREKLFDTLSSWRARILAVLEGGRFAGYIVYTAKDTEHRITEIKLCDFNRLPETIGLFLRNGRAAGMRPWVEINACPHEREKIAALSRFAENYDMGSAYHFAVLDYLRFTEPFLKLKARGRNLADGSFVFQVDEEKPLCLAVKGGVPSITETARAPALCLKNLEALHFLFSPLAAYNFPASGENAFLQSLLPLPLFFEKADEI